MLKQFIEQLSKDLQMTELLAPNEDGSYSLSFEPDVQISLRENVESGITLFAPIAPLPSEKVEEFLCYAMAANLFGKETGGGILGLDKEGKKLTFTCFLPQQISYKEFHDALEDFVNYAESWKLETTHFVGTK